MHHLGMGNDTLTVLAVNLNRFVGQVKVFSSNEALAAACGLGRSTIDRVRKAEVALRVDKLEYLAGALGLEPWELLNPNLQLIWPFDGVKPADYALVDPAEREEVNMLAISKVNRLKSRV